MRSCTFGAFSPAHHSEPSQLELMLRPLEPRKSETRISNNFFSCAALQPFHSLIKVTELHSNSPAVEIQNSTSTHARARSFSAFSFSKCREEKWKKEPSINFIGKAFSAALDQSRFSQMNNVKKQYKNSRERHWAGREIESDFEKLFFPSIVQLLAMLFKWAVNLKDFKIALASKQRRGVLLPCLSAGDTHKWLISH